MTPDGADADQSAQQPSWQRHVDRGFEAPLFRQFDAWGETHVRERFSKMVERWQEHARLWLADVEEERTRREEATRAEMRSYDRRMAEAAERSADAAETSAREATAARRIAHRAFIVSIVAALIAAAALAVQGLKPEHAFQNSPKTGKIVQKGDA